LTVTDDDGDSDKYQLTIEVSKKPQDDETKSNFFSNIWNVLGIGLVIIIVTIILAFIMSKRKKVSEIPEETNETLFPSIIETSCPECGQIFEITEKTRPFQIECPNCGTKGLMK
jgi:hypothetical protein